MVPRINVLVTGSGSVTAQSVIKGLRAQREFRLRIVVTDSYRPKDSAGYFLSDAFYQIPSANQAGYISALKNVCRREKIQLLIPIVDPELLRIAQSRKIFERLGIVLPLSSADTIAMCNDKFKTYQFFNRHRIPTATSWIPGHLPSKLTFPLIIKPRGGISSRDVFMVKNRSELKSAIARVDRPVISELLHGQEYTIDVFSDLEHRVIGVVPRKRLETKSGVSTKGVTTNEPNLIAWAKKIAEVMPLVGPANIQCFVDRGQPKFFEINPRFSGTLALSIAAGMNSPHYLLKLVAGQRLTQRIGQHKAGVKMIRYWSEIFFYERNLKRIT